MNKKNKPVAAGSTGKKAKAERFVALVLYLLRIPFIWVLKDGRFVRLDEDYLDKLIPNFSQEPLPERDRLLDRFLRKRCKVKQQIKWSKALANSTGKVLKDGKKQKATLDDLRNGACAFFSIPALFAEKATGTSLMGDLLCGLVCSRLKEEAFPDLHLTSAIKESSTFMFSALSAVFNAVVTKTEWTRNHLLMVF